MDLVQSAWVHLLQSLHRGSLDFSNVGGLRAFLRQVIRHRLIDHARSVQASRRREELAAQNRLRQKQSAATQ